MNRPRKDSTNLDQVLQRIRFTPRSSLGAEIVGRWRRGERARAERGGWFRNLRRLSMAGGLFGLGVVVVWLFAPQPAPLLTVDRCCQDLDGGGDRDDGVLVVTDRGSDVKRLAIYEDRDDTESYTRGDMIRFQRDGSPGSAEPIADGARTARFCCLDYDGGGPKDDALLVIGVPPGQISMAAIYEHRASQPTIRLR